MQTKPSMKYLFVTGGVCSSLGKGLTAASIGMLLEKKGRHVALLKLEPYLNVDPGTMSPFQHGEVYVTDDGAETDLDLGHYHRFTKSPLTASSNVTSGQVYNTVLHRERRGDYLGKTVQVIPHITDEIKQRILHCAKENEETDVLIVEIGGTIGDIESLPFLETIRQFCNTYRHDCLNIHLTYVPYIRAAGEFKSKPTQHAVQALRGIGIIPDLLLCRCENSLPEEVKDKIALFSSVPRRAVFDEVDVPKSIYEVPMMLHQQGVDQLICELLQLPCPQSDWGDWQTLIDVIYKPKGTLKVGFVGKYVQHQDAYKSVYEALQHAALAEGYALEIVRFESDKVVEEGKLSSEVKGCDGYLVPGGFGDRGWLGKILTAQYCRENKVPYFGICLGMQVMVVEYARNVLGLQDANSTEMDLHTEHPVISLLSEQRGIENMGGTMRLGRYQCQVQSGTRAHAAYGKSSVGERHRHRYEVNNQYVKQLEQAGLVVSGLMETEELCEIVEVANHPWMLGVQFHPEFTSKPTAPHPLFRHFIRAILAEKQKNGA